jgi:hypothetical protein
MNSRAQMDDGGCRSCTYTMLLRPLSRLKRRTITATTRSK